MTDKIFDCIILGGGPAGLSSALYCARGNLDCAIVDNNAIGGTPVNYSEVENYLGFDKIKGFELSEKFEQHVDSFNVEKFPYEEIKKVDLISPIKTIETQDKILKTRTVIIATGARNKKLNIKGEDEFYAKGVSYCAVCDGAFYKDKVVAVVGGGNSALEEALYLTRFAKKVYLIHRRDEFRADKIVQNRIKHNIVEILGKEKVEKIKVENTKTNKIKELKIDGIFPYIGIEPNSELFNSQIEQDSFGFIITDETMKTNRDGVYAIGDIRKTPLRQIITAVSDGAIAGTNASNYVKKLKKGE